MITLTPVSTRIFIALHSTYRIYSSISRTFLYLKISPKTGVRLILEAMGNDLLKSALILMKTCDFLICLLQRRCALTKLT